jgi:hypothetical protein
MVLCLRCSGTGKGSAAVFMTGRGSLRRELSRWTNKWSENGLRIRGQGQGRVTEVLATVMEED